MFSADEIKRWDTQVQLSDGEWVLARPINYRYESWWRRIKQSWDVLVGKADALCWREQ